jgi:hypothetical protein
VSGSELPLSYRRLPQDPSGTVLDAITVDARSSGQLHLPGTYSNLAPPPAYRYRISPTGDHGVEAVPVQTGTSREYVVRVDIQNHRTGPLTVRLYWVRQPEDIASELPADVGSEPTGAKRWRRRGRPEADVSGEVHALPPEAAGGGSSRGDTGAEGPSVGDPVQPPEHPTPEEQAERVLAEVDAGPSPRTAAEQVPPLPDDQIAEMVEEANDVER